MSTAEREQALLAVLEEHRSSECARLQAEADKEASELLRDARSQARQRVHRAVVRERERAAMRIRAAQAELNTRRREHQQRLGWALLRVARGQLEQALVERWGQLDARRAWVEATLGRALARLPAGSWTVRHPADWPEAERSAFLEDLASRGEDIAVGFLPDQAIRAGIIISSASTSLDASVRGLLSDRQATEAELLARLAEGGAL